jgi:outer membrane protein assembly factor BamB
MPLRPHLFAVAVAGVCTSAFAGNWPQWRGPAGDGVSSDPNLPLHWSEMEHIAWKCPLPDGASTPIVWSDAVFLTAEDAGKLILYRIDRNSGKVAWSQQVGSGAAVKKVPRRDGPRRGSQQFHELHNFASPSAVTDGDVVITHFGNGDLAAYDFSGKQLWKHNLQAEHGSYTIWWGHANSPVLCYGLVISVCVQDSLADVAGKKQADSYIVAHDARTGEQRWKTLRATGAPTEEADAYTTPLVRDVDGRKELVVMGGNQLDAYDPATGRQLWWLPDLVGGRTVCGPTNGGGLIFATRGKSAPLIAVKPAGTGRLGPESIVWEQAKGTADSSSLLFHDGLLFWVTDAGVANCVDAATGKPHWSQRLPRGNYKASPIVAGNHIYFLSLDGMCTVIAAAPKFEKLAENSVHEPTIASLAAADGRLFLRSRSALYCIE